MRPVRRDEILDWATYEDVRDRWRERVLAAKSDRRVSLGPYITLLFENPLTIRYQIQEMVRVERIVREADIRREIDTYNEILGGEDAIGCTLLVEIDAPSERDARLREWWALPEHVYLRLEDGRRIGATFDPRQRGDGRLSAVQYLQFDVDGLVPAAAGIDLTGLDVETALPPATRCALADDLKGVEELPAV